MKIVEYSCSRLCFKADKIEPLGENDSFIMHTPDGSFQLTKAEFQSTFPNVPLTKSYRVDRLYHYRSLPKQILPFLIPSATTVNSKSSGHKVPVDLVGDKIRGKIKEIGVLWRNSDNNPAINGEIMKGWVMLIKQWSEDKDIPLIVRKDTSKKGQSFVHPCGREIIISDNTFAIWVFGRVLNGEIFTLSQLKEMLQNNDIPMVFMQTKAIKEKAKYSKALGAYSLPKWKLCHIESVGFNTNKNIVDLDIQTIQEHFRKYASPDNMFVLPKEIGDLGEIEAFIDAQRDKYKIL